MERYIRYIFTGAVFGLHLTLSVPIIVLNGIESGIYWVLFSILYEFLALGIALDLTELVFGLLMPSNSHPRIIQADRIATRVAVLYVCCDDIEQESLRNLSRLRGVDIFILDDSKRPESRSLVDNTIFKIIRKPKELGYKAGSLNHWMECYGDFYDYFVILDSDSIISADALWELVAFAEHPLNQDVAIVQPLIYPRIGNSFQQLLGIASIARYRILSRLHDRIGWSLSHGHNNLHRTKAVKEIGGFGLCASCEDTIISLQLSQRGWRIILVDIVSYDCEPSNAFVFRRRMVRWARQTVDVLMNFKGKVTWSHGFLIARHFFAYLLPFSIIVLLVFVSLTTDIPVEQAWDIVCGNFSLRQGYIIPGLIGYLFCTVFFLTMSLRLCLFCQAGGSFSSFLLSTILWWAISGFCSFHIVLGILKSFLFGKTVFSPSGMHSANHYRLYDFWRAMAIPWIIYIGIMGILLTKPGILLFGINSIWATTLLLTPLVLWLFHVDHRRDKIQ